MILEACGVRKLYGRGEGEVEALRGVDLSLSRSEFAAIMGPSGCGKSTLLHLLGALDRPTKGAVRFEGKDLSSLSDRDLSIFRRQRLGFIFQFFNLVATLSAAENVALPLLLDGKPYRKVREEALRMLEMVGLKDRADHRPNQLSGGQMQRVAIARALIAKPMLILADEPTGNLDSSTGSQILGLLRKLCEDFGQTILMVTHDPAAARFGTRLIEMKDGLIASDRTL